MAKYNKSEMQLYRSQLKRCDRVDMSQKLPSGKTITVIWERDEFEVDKRWRPFYTTDSAYHICPFDGRFISCINCECYNDLSNESMQEACWSKLEYISDDEMALRIAACAQAENCTVEFRGRP